MFPAHAGVDPDAALHIDLHPGEAVRRLLLPVEGVDLHRADAVHEDRHVLVREHLEETTDVAHRATLGAEPHLTVLAPDEREADDEVLLRRELLHNKLLSVVYSDRPTVRSHDRGYGGSAIAVYYH